MTTSAAPALDPVAALHRVAYCLDRILAEGHRVQAYVKAADVVAALPPGELEARHADGTLTDLPGIGKKTASIVTQALDGGPIPYLDELEASTQITTSEPGAAAVREHEANVRRREFSVRPQDQHLYRRLRQICGDV